jgi:uncharacterized protein YdhG (YjbR/CyaY superfamily)
MMKTEQTVPKTIDEYIAGFPPDVQAILEKIRATIKAEAPDAEEAISYRMPTFKLKGYLVFFAAFKQHIGLFGNTTVALETFKDELAIYTGPKGSLKFPYNQPMPYELIGKIVKVRVAENLASANAKGKIK